jgi:MFS family permease
MNRRGERAVGVMGLAILSLGYVLFGLIDVVAPILAPVSPLRVLDLFGFALTPEIEAAGLISILTAFGSTGTGAAVQTYVNRYVLLARQATTFGMQEVLDNAMTLFAVLTLGALATGLGPRLVFVVAPPFIVLVVVGLIRIGSRITAQDSPQTRVILHALLNRSPVEQTER